MKPAILGRKLEELPIYASPLVDFIRLGLQHRALPLTSGQPAPEALPLEDLARLAPEALRSRGRKALLYGSNRGLGELRRALTEWQVRSGVLPEGLGDEEVMLTLGSQYAFDLICQGLIRRGDEVACDAPCYPDTWCTALRRGASVLPLPVDEEGLDPDHLEALLAGGHRPVLVYTVLHYQNPCGCSLSPSRQRRLLELAETYDFLVVLDDPYRMLALDGPPPCGSDRFPRLGWDTGRLLYLGSLSKVLAPGVRLGWLAGHRELVAGLAKLQEMSLISLPALDGLIVLEYLLSEGMTGQLSRMVRFLKERRDVLAEGLRARCLPLGCTLRVPSGGCFLRLELPDLPATPLARELAERHGVATVPEAAFWPPSQTPAPDRFLRLSFSWCTPEELAEAAERIARALEGRPR